MSSKYSTFLTVLLVLAIIAIIVLLGFFGYDIYSKISINKGAEDAISRFEDAIKEENNNQSESIENNSDSSTESVESPIGSVSQSSVNYQNNGSGGTTYQGYAVVGKIKIPAINIEYPILEKVTKKSIQIAVAVLYGPGVNKTGNTVIVGHNYRNGTFFSNLSKLKNGDKIYITDASGKQVEYTVYKNYETTAEDTTYMTRDTAGKMEISLSTCTVDSNYRTIILAKAE